MKLLPEENERIFLTEQDMKDFFVEQESREIWKTCYTNELTVFPVPGRSCALYDAENVRRSCAFDTGKVSDDSIHETVDGSKLGISVPLERKENYPVGSTAFISLIQRAGYGSASVITCQKNKTSQKEMSPDDKSLVLNLGLKCFANKALVLIRDEKVRAVLSGDESDYSRLPCSLLYQKMTDVLDGMYSKWTFESASTSHLFTTVLINLNDEKLKKDIQETFLKARIKESGVPMVRMVTSDVGRSGANLYPILRNSMGREITIGIPLTLTHSDRHSVDDFGNNVMMITAMFRDAKKNLEEMSHRQINHPAGCLRAVAKKCSLPKKLVCNEAKIFEATYVKAYEIDVYYKLFDLLDMYIMENHLTAARALPIQESIARIAFTNMSDHDYEFDWD